jgi:DNA-binding NarL/FixJ family response regulator
MKKREVATLSQRISCHERLKEVLVVTDPENRMCEFRDGFDDQRIARELNMGESSVKAVRTEMFGRLRVTSKEQNEIDKLKAAFADLAGKHNKLVVLLSLNRVADVKHLQVPTTDAPLLGA